MKGTFKRKDVVIISILIALCVAIIGVSTYKAKHVDNKTANLTTAQDLVSLTYNEVTDDSVKNVDPVTGELGDTCEFVEFNAFFTQDLNNDGVAERVDGACRDINSTAQIYFRFSVLSKGYLKDGKIKINGQNFKLSTAIPADSVISKSYIESDTKQINLAERVENGTQKLIAAQITPRIINTNDYSKNNNTVVFEGTYVYEDESGNEIEVPLRKTCNLTVDWYGDLNTQIVSKQTLSYSTENIVGDDGNVNLEFTVKTRELNNYAYNKNGLLLDSNVVEVKVPEVKGYSANGGVVYGENVTGSFNKETGILTVTRKSEVDENGNIVTSLPYDNEYTIVMQYPAEIYDDNVSESLIITVPVETYYTGYNNLRAEFENEIATNIAKSNVAQVNLAITYEKPTEEVFELKTTIGEYVRTPNERYVVSKKETIKAYNEAESEVQDIYEVRWLFYRGSEGTITSTDLAYTKPEYLNKDSFDDYTTNLGIYFDGATSMLGQNGYIKVYDADKTGDGALLHTFTIEDWATYTKQNPYMYDEPVKNIRIEISESNKETSLIIHHVKEIDNEKLAGNYTKEEFENKNLIYTYLSGTIYNGIDSESLTRTGVAYYEDEKSIASISIDKDKIATTETNENETITITTQSGYNKAKWKDGEFVIALPEGIANININSVVSQNNNVTIKGYNIENQDGIYLIRILTENDTPTDNIWIRVNCDITPDATLPTTTDRVSLFAYNPNYENYDILEEDIYDANNNGNKKDIVGYASDELQMVAPTGLVTYQTATNYDDEQDDELTISPNVAEVKKEQRSAQINVDVLNNYSSTVTGTKILGKIPYEGNTYVITGGELGSTFTTTLTSKVELSIAQNYKQDFNEEKLNELRSNIKIYYSEKETPTNDLSLASNGWIEESEVTDVTNFKSYLIDLGDYAVNIGDDIGFKYTVSIPENIDYEKVSYAQHAVYFNLNTPDGLLADYTEPNKLGIKITRKYNLNLTKNVLGKTQKVANAVYLLETGSQQDNTYQSFIKLTDENGNINISGLYVEKTYKLTELKSEDDYEVAEETLEFKVVENRQTEDLEIQINSEGAGYKSSSVQNDDVNIAVQDRARYDLNLIKYRAKTNEKVADVEYRITAGTQGSSDYEAYRKRTNEDGTITINNLYLDKIYTVQEVSTTQDFSMAEGVLQFKVGQSSTDGTLSIQIIGDGAGYRANSINDNEELVTLEVENDLKYKLKLNKKDAENNNNLTGIEYKVKGPLVDSNKLTDENGNIEISGLKVNETYVVQEVTAKGYYLNDSFEVIVTRNEDGSLSSNIGTIVDNTLSASVELNITDEKIPTYDLDIIKIEKGNENKKLKDVTFVIKGRDLNETLTTDENGKISLSGLYQYVEGKDVDGIYTIEEQIPAQGYVLASEILKIKVFKDGNNLKVETLQGENIIADKDGSKNIQTTNSKVTITLQNIPTFKIKKIDGTNQIAIPNTKFAIYKITYDQEENETIEPATDASGNKIGEEETINGETYYVIKTNEDGEITADLVEGLYCLEEIEAAEGYELPEKAQDRKHYFGVGESKAFGGVKFDRTTENSVGSEAIYLAIKETTDGYYAIGLTNNDMEIEQLDGTTKTVSQHQNYVVKINKNGEIVWCNPTDTFYYDIEVSSNGDCIVIGYGDDAVFEKYDSDGNLVKEYTDAVSLGIKSGVMMSVIINNLVQTGRGFYLEGDIGFEEDADFVTITTVDQGEKLVNNGEYIVEYDYDFNVLAYYNTSDEEYSQIRQIFELGKLKENGYSKVGYFTTETPFVTKQQGNVILKNGSVVAYDENGIEDWAYSFEDENIQLATSVKVADGGVVVIGNLMADNTLNIDGKQYNLKSSGIAIKFDMYGKFEGITDGFEYISYANNLTDSNLLEDSDGRVVYAGGRTNLSQTFQPAYFETFEYAQINPEYTETQEITIENEMKEFKITTEVKQGEGTISGEDETPYETVVYKKDSTKEIKVVPADGWVIRKITVNGEVVDFTANGDGSYILEQFSEMTEDKHVAVWFEKEGGETNYNYEVKKTDKDGNPLENVKFTIKKIIKKDDSSTELQWAKDLNGNIVGYKDNINGKTMYVVESDGNGLIRLNLENGDYVLSEVEAPEIYEVSEYTDVYFTIENEDENVIEVNCIQDLVDISNAVNSGETTYEGTTIKLMRDLDFTDDDSYRDVNHPEKNRSPEETTYGNINGDENTNSIKTELTTGTGFTPIGKSWTLYFSGVFDGQNHEIRNLYVNSEFDYIGLFGVVKHTTIMFLGVTGNVNSNASSSSRYAGGIVGRMEDSSISNCYNIADVSGKGTYNFVGGIAGSLVYGSISCCYNMGNISGSGSNYCYVGGIAGNESYSSINNCYNTGYISGRGSNVCNVSGIVREMSGNVYNCYNIGDISSTSSSSKEFNTAGGISTSNSRIYNCYYLETIKITGIKKDSGTEISDDYMKSDEFFSILNVDEVWENEPGTYPLLKKAEKTDFITEINYIEDLVEISKLVNKGFNYAGITVTLNNDLDFEAPSSYKNGVVDKTLTIAGGGAGFTPIGKSNTAYFLGIFDGQNHEIKNLYINNSSGDVGLFGYIKKAKIKSLGVTGSVNTSNNYAGGVVGYVNDSSIVNCYSTVTVSSGSCAGGIAGYTINSRIINCYNIGNISGKLYAGGITGSAINSSNITNCYNRGDVSIDGSSGTRYLGGVAGYTGKSSINNCYSTGNISHSSGSGSKYAGGIVGFNSNSSIDNCYKLSSATINNASVTNMEGLEVSSQTMKLLSFSNTLNENKYTITSDETLANWIYNENDYPTLIMDNVLKKDGIVYVNFINTKKRYVITTEILPNSEQRAVGGNITGESIDGEDYKFVEEVIYNEDSEISINISPNAKYYIEKIIIDGEEQDFTVDDNGTVTLDTFKNVTQDHHVQVIFEKIPTVEANFTLTKINNNGDILPGAKFTIKRISEDNEGNIQEVEALDSKGNIVGTLEDIYGEELYVVTSDENGEIKIDLPVGKYKIKEVKAPEGYFLKNPYEEEFEIEEKTLKEKYNYTESVLQGAIQENNKLTTDGGRICIDSDYCTIRKYNNTNNEEWSTNIKKEGNLWLWEVTELVDGNYLVTGHLEGSLTIDASNLLNSDEDLLINSTTGDDADAIAIKLNPDGKVISCEKITECSSHDYAFLLKIQDDGSYYVIISGSQSKKFSADKTVSGEEIVIDTTICLIHYNANGKIIDVNPIKTMPSIDVLDIVKNDNGYDIFFNNFANSALILSFDKEGNSTVKSVYSLLSSITLYSIKPKDDGGYIAVGCMYNNSTENIVISGEQTSTGNPITLTLDNTEGRYPEPVVVEFDEQFKVENAFSIACPNIGMLYSVDKMDNGDYVAVGYVQSGIKITENIGYNGYTYEDVSTTQKGLVLQITPDRKVRRAITSDSLTKAFRFVDVVGDYIVAHDGTNAVVFEAAREKTSINLEVINKKSGKVVVHHYLKLPDGTLTEQKVADDETIEDMIDEDYVTFPQKDLDLLDLEKVDGEYVLPSNITGKITEETQEVIFYYEPADLQLTINHYYEGTETRIDDIEAETKTYPTTVVDNGDGTYTLTAEGSYDVDTNQNYNSIINDYNFTRVTSDIQDETSLEDNLTFSKNSVINFYYTRKEHTITTEVIPHTEIRTDSLTKEKAEMNIDGGTITGEYNDEYKKADKIKFIETVPQSQNQSQETTITATPDEGYRVKTIKLISTSDDGETNEKILYGENADENTEITATRNADGSITLTTFENVVANKHITVEFAPYKGNVIVHHYYEGTGEEYNNEPVLVKDRNGNEIAIEGKEDYIGESYATKPSDDVAVYYQYVSSSGKTNGNYEDETIHVYYYYKYNEYEYSIHYYYDGVEDSNPNSVESGTAKYADHITEYPDKIKEGYGFEKVTPSPNNDENTNLVITEINENNRINVYYRTKYKVTTDVIEHTETNKETIDDEGNVTQNVTTGIKGGSISGEDENPYEIVLKGYDSKENIEIRPASGYEIVKVTIKDNKNAQTGAELDVNSMKDSNGNIILNANNGYFTDMQSDKHVEVEFRKKSNVIVKYLSATETDEYGNPLVLATEEHISGYETKDFTTEHKPVQYYMDSSKGITDENDNEITKYSRASIGDNDNAEGTMYADTLTIIYWYERIPSGIAVKHIEIDEKQIEDGLTMESGTILDEEVIPGYVSLTETTNRNIYNSETGSNLKYKDYISVNGPTSTNQDLIITDKDENSKQVVYKDGVVVEVRYYYEKQYKVTTEVKAHEEEDASGNTILVDGGTISGKGDEVYEIINNRGYNSNEITMTPDDGYRIKQVTIESTKTEYKDGQIVETTETNTYTREELNENTQTHAVTLKGGQDDAYFTDVQANKHVIVEYEKIPAKVTVKYMDKDTNEEIPSTPEKVLEGFVNDEFNEPRINIDTYIPADDTEQTPEPTEEEYKGKMTEEPIEIIYWYTKQFKITTEVLTHSEVDKDGNEQDEVKGGTITADITEQKDEEGNVVETPVPYEIVLRGESNKKELEAGSGVAIEIVPDDGYRIREIAINGELVYKTDAGEEFENDNKLIIEDKKVQIPTEYFTNMQENKHITVMFERIPTVVKVQYLEEGTEKVLYETEDGKDHETIEGSVYDKYETKEKEIEYYELVEEKYPENASGTMTEDEIVVKYYYKRLPFNFKLEKEITKVELNGESIEVKGGDTAKVNIKYKEINEANLKVTYKIKVTNTEKVEGIAIIEELIPQGFEFVLDESSKGWLLSDGKYVLETKILNPGETAEYEVVLKWNAKEENKGTKSNTARIAETKNNPEFDETTTKDNEDDAVIEIKIEKTLPEILDDVAGRIKTGDWIVAYQAMLLIAIGAIVVTLKVKTKNK